MRTRKHIAACILYILQIMPHSTSSYLHTQRLGEVRMQQSISSWGGLSKPENECEMPTNFEHKILVCQYVFWGLNETGFREIGKI